MDAEVVSRYINRVNSSFHYEVDGVNVKSRHTGVSPTSLCKKWNIGLNTAEATLKATTQHYIRSGSMPMFRRFKQIHPRDRFKNINDTFYMDTLYGRADSYHGNKYAQVFTNRNLDFIYVSPMKKKDSYCIISALYRFMEDVGIPSMLKMDQATEVMGERFVKFCRRYNIRRKYFPTGSHEGNRAESAIRELKRRWKFDMIRRRVPRRFWDLALIYHAELLSLIVRRRDGRTGVEVVTGETPDISAWLDFDFYCPVFYIHEYGNQITRSNAQIGRWLGVAHNITGKLCYYILTGEGKVIARHCVQHITLDELKTTEVVDQLSEFDKKIHLKKDSIVMDTGDWLEQWQLDLDKEIDDKGNELILNFSSEDARQQANYDPSVNDEAVIDYDDFEPLDGLLGAKTMLTRGGVKMEGCVRKLARDINGKTIGKFNSNPLLDTRQYEVAFEDGEVLNITANDIASNIYSQCDEQGREFELMEDIVDHMKDQDVLTKEQATAMMDGKTSRRTTKGWWFLVQWKKGESTWVPLKELMNSNPLELAEYVVSRNLQDEPALSWWVTGVLKGRQHIISKVKVRSKYWRTSHKLGIRLPHSVQEALRLDKENGNTLWEDAIKKEMVHVRPAFKEWDGNPDEAKRKLVGYQRINCHMIFDIKMDFTRKARFVAGGHTTETPASITYSSVVSRDSVRLMLMLAAMNDVPLLSADIGNAYLNATCRERIWIVAGPEFGNLQGKVLLIEKALYGLKSSGAAWRAMLRETLLEMEFVDTVADHDVYRRRAIKPDGTAYYEYLCVYVDDLLVASHRAEEIMSQIASTYRLKDTPSVPDVYLGASISKIQDGDRHYWAMDAHKYVKSAVMRVEKDGYLLSKKRSAVPLPSSYHPEVDESELLNPELSTRYQEYIGMLRWACELGRIDILLETALMSQYLAAPREGHLQMVIHIFSYLCYHVSFPIGFDPSDDDHDPTVKWFDGDWKEDYPDAEDLDPPNMPEPLGSGVRITAYVDANHAGNLVNRRSHSGFIIFTNYSPIVWFSKKQNSVESSTFGSEFNALRICTEHISALRYKLKMFGVKILGPAGVRCDNEAVTTNARDPTSQLNKKHNSICYHLVREAVAAGILKVAHIDGANNPADLFTKILNKAKRFQFVRMLTRNKINRDGVEHLTS